MNTKLFQDSKQVEGIALQGGIAVEIEVIGVGGAGSHVVVEHHTKVVEEMRYEVFPHGLVCAEAVSQNYVARAGSQNLHVVSFFHYPHFFSVLLLTLRVQVPDLFLLLFVHNKQACEANAERDQTNIIVYYKIIFSHFFFLT